MVTTKINFGDQGSEERRLAAVPDIGSPISGPNRDGTIWKVTATVCETDGSAIVYCKPMPLPEMIYGVTGEAGLIGPARRDPGLIEG